MSHPIRIECRFCSHGFNVDADRAGARVKCPKCQNPLIIPVPDADEDDGAPAKPMRGGPSEAKQVAQRPISRGSGGGFGRLVKWAVLALIAIAGWYGYGQYKARQDKSIPDLLSEFASPETNEAIKQADRQIILDKAGPDDLGAARRFVDHGQADVRSLAAEVLGKTKKKEAHEPLAKLATKDKDPGVRKTATRALGSIRTMPAIETLMGIVGDLKETADIRGDAMASLRDLTGMNFVNYTEWPEWWKSRGAGWSLKDPAP